MTARTPTFGRGLLLLAGAVNFGCGLALPISMSVMFLDWQESFSTTRAVTAAVHSTSVGILFGGGVIAGYVVKRFGARLSFILGSFLATLGMFLGAFATNIPFLLASVGVVAGCGCCLIQLPCIPCCTRPFKTNQGVAIAAVATGAAVVSLLFPYLYDYLIHMYSWRGAFIIISGMCLNTLALELVLTSYVSSTKPTKVLTASSDAVNLLPRDTDISANGDHLDSKGCHKDPQSSLVHNKINHLQNDDRKDMELDVVTSKQAENFPNGENKNAEECYASPLSLQSSFEGQRELRKGNGRETEIMSNTDSLPKSFPETNGSDSKTSRKNSLVLKYKHVENIDKESLTTQKKNVTDNNIESNINCAHIDTQNNKHDTASDQPFDDCCLENEAAVSSTNIQVEPADIALDISLSRLSIAELKQSPWKFLFDSLAWTVLAFLGLTLGAVFSIQMLAMDIAANKGFPQHGLALIMVGIVSGLVAKALSGVFGLCRNLPSFLILAAAGFLGSVGLAMVGWVISLDALVASMSILGLSLGFIVSVFPKCFLDMPSVGPVSYPLALGMGNTVEGIFDFLFPVLIGHMVDVSGTYTLPCSILSVVTFLCSCVLVVVYLKNKNKSSR